MLWLGVGQAITLGDGSLDPGATGAARVRWRRNKPDG
jgi:hypothetical protein